MSDLSPNATDGARRLPRGPQRTDDAGHGKGLSELAATAICGNDITSSCLYVAALATLYAGKWAPVALLLVAGVLYLFRGVYAEVVGALPLNGGAYNALLNTTSKFRASVAACLTILSYMATAVISASEAMHYAHSVWSGIPILTATVVLLGLFLVLSIVGMSESANVAIAIFLLHMFTMALLLFVGLAALPQLGLDTLSANLATPSPGGIGKALLFGFAAALLGISGFESSANFVEEQRPGVFPKTLRNMWLAVTVLNPGTALLVLALLPIAVTLDNQEALLAHLGGEVGGPWLALLVSVDATLVLSGAVLTSFVGVNGLVRRMTLDRVLPQFLLKENRRGTTHRILIAFFLLTTSILLITKGELAALAGVYTLSFLCVMALFGIGNILLKVRRAKLPRPERASWPGVIIAILAVIVGFIGNAVMNPQYLAVFLKYFVPSVLIVAVMLGRIQLLRMVLFMVRASVGWAVRSGNSLRESLRNQIDLINSQQIVFFSRGDNVANLNNVILYVRRNEHTNRLKVVIVVEHPDEVPKRLATDLDLLDQAYPEIEIELQIVEGRFGPALVKRLSEEWSIPRNFMFIGSPGNRFPYRLEELGGVRLII